MPIATCLRPLELLRSAEHDIRDVVRRAVFGPIQPEEGA